MTGRFQRRALTVEAWQFDDGGPAMPRWLDPVMVRLPLGRLRIFTSAADDQGQRKFITAELGDWILLYPDGRISIMPAGIFEAEFETDEPMSLDRARDILKGVTLGDIEKMLARLDTGETVPGIDSVDQAVGVLVDHAARGR